MGDDHEYDHHLLVNLTDAHRRIVAALEIHQHWEATGDTSRFGTATSRLLLAESDLACAIRMLRDRAEVRAACAAEGLTEVRRYEAIKPRPLAVVRGTR